MHIPLMFLAVSCPWRAVPFWEARSQKSKLSKQKFKPFMINTKVALPQATWELEAIVLSCPAALCKLILQSSHPWDSGHRGVWHRRMCSHSRHLNFSTWKPSLFRTWKGKTRWSQSQWRCCLSQPRVYCLSQDKGPMGNEGMSSQAAPARSFNVLSLNSIATNQKAVCNKERGLERMWEIQGKIVFWIQSGSCTYELAEVVTACTRAVQTLPLQNPRMERGGGHKVPPPTWGATGSWWLLGKGQSVFFRDAIPERLPKFQ